MPRRIRLGAIQWLILSAAALVIAIMLGTGYFAMQYRERALEVAERELNNSALLLSRHFDQQLLDLQHVQEDVVTSMRADGVHTADDFESKMSTSSAHEMLRAKLSVLPHFDALNLWSARGALINSSEMWPVADKTNTDRRYFQEFMSGKPAPDVIVEPVVSRVTKVWTTVFARKHRGPDLGHPAHDRLDDHVGRRLARHELLEVAAVRDGLVGHRPHLRRIDQRPPGAPEIQGVEVRQHRKLRAQHFVRARCRHLAFEVVGGVDAVRPHAGDDVFLDMLEVQQLLVEMPRQQQRAVVEFALGDFQRPLAVLHGEIAGAEHDRDHKRRRTQDQPLDGAEPDPPRHDGAERRPAFRDDFLR